MSYLSAADPRRRPRILLIDADEGVRRQLQLVLDWHGYDVRSFGTAAPVLQGGYSDATDILITDYAPPDSNGIAVLRILQSRGWEGRAVLITGTPSLEQERCARASGFAAVLEKPVHHGDLIAAIALN
ncbi:response regulator [Sphingomonas glacialis]|uniref:Response regulator n=1 Tax=Sphingomonas glacialis TaxID=658225 RepID=A0A502FXR1_9SPHN|nr:response regulator [Sphingomonas glacialis]TPG54130.1 response regulator [Sphingomonas glacialis]